MFFLLLLSVFMCMFLHFLQNFIRLHFGDSLQDHINVVGLKSKDTFTGTGLSSIGSDSRMESDLTRTQVKTSKLNRHQQAASIQDMNYWKVPTTDISSSVMSHSIISMPRTATPDEPLKHQRLALVKSFKKGTLRNHRIEKLASEVDSYTPAPSWLSSGMKFNSSTQKTPPNQTTTNPSPIAKAVRDDIRFPPLGN